MSRSKHQTLKSVADGRAKAEIAAAFAEHEADAVELAEKGRIKKRVQADRQSRKAEAKMFD